VAGGPGGLFVNGMGKIKKNKNCRACKSSNFLRVLDLGKMPSANAFLTKSELKKREHEFPLIVNFCKNCGLVQLRDIVDPSYLFTHYDYMTSASRPLVDYFHNFSNILEKRFLSSRADLIVEIGGNDGVLLNNFKNQYRVLNIEPAKNIATISLANGVEVINDFFSEQIAKKIVKKYGHASILTASNVFAHIDDLDDILKGARYLLKKDGVFSIENHWVGNLVNEGGYDQIYHEHLSYFSLASLSKLARRMGFKVFDAELTDMHGKTLRAFLSKDRKQTPNVKKILKIEGGLKLNKPETYLQFAEKVKRSRIELREVILKLKKEGKNIIGYGAPAKGNTLLNFCGINRKHLDFIIDTTILKQGLYAPGSKIPVLHPDNFKESKPDFALLLAWNYADVILKKEKEFQDNGGKFIIPVPLVKII
jgi:hypothetical protein